MPRSGSTWLFNTVRLILKTAGVPDFVSGHSTEKAKLFQHETVLIKIHRFDAELAKKADVILTSHRDLRDVAASANRKFETEFSTAKVAEWVKGQVRWSQVADYDLHYEQLLVDRIGEVRNVAAVLRLPPETMARLPYEEILQQVDGAKFATKFSETVPHDVTTLLHKGHITDGRHGSWKGSAPEGFVAAVEKEFRGWMVGKGYLAANAS